MARKTTLEKALEALDEMEYHRVTSWAGGYPQPVVNFPPGWVTRAVPDDSKDGGRVTLEFYREKTVRRWYLDARKLMRENPGEFNLVEAMYETEPEQDQ